MSQSWKTVKTLLTSKSLKVQFIPTDSTCTLLTSQSFKVQFIPTPLLSAFLFPTIGSVWQSVYCACQCCDVCAMALAINCIQGRSWSLDWSNNRIGSFSSFFCLSQCHCLWFTFSVQVVFLSTKPWQFHLQKDCPARHIWPDYRFCLGPADADELGPPRVIIAASSISLPPMSLVMFCASKWPTSMNFFFSLTWLCTSHSSGNKFTSCHTCSPVANAIHHPRIWFHLLAPTVGQMCPWLQSQALITILTQVTNTFASMHPSFNSLIWRFSPFGCDPSSKNPACTWGTIL